LSPAGNSWSELVDPSLISKAIKSKNVDSEELYLFYQQNGINYEELPITEEDFKSWIHYFIIFKENGGDP
jgi:hypothetical protein